MGNELSSEEKHTLEQEKLQPVKTKATYFNECKKKYFLASKAVTAEDGFTDLQNISEIKNKLEATYGARMGAGATKRYLEPRGFVDDKPFGAFSIILNDDLGLHHKNLDDNGGWKAHYAEYASATKFGVLILAGSIQNFKTWASSQPCLDEVSQIPDGRLFAFIEHRVEDGFEKNQGFIVSIDAQNNKGAATVRDGKGYTIYASGNYYCGDLKGGYKHGSGVMKWGPGKWEGDVYEGEYKNDEQHGYGIYTWADGTVYEGNWKEGKKNGHGVITYANGDVYEGNYKEDNKNGSGVYTYASGDVYDGEWKNDKRHDRNGIYTYASGRKTKGVYENGKCISETPI